jgi:hypothetical protein
LGTIAGFVLGFIPFVKTYQFAIQICSIIVLVFGVYLEGGLADYKEWELKVKEMEAKVAKAEADSANKNVEIQEKIVEKTKIIREKGRDIITYIDKEIIKIAFDCEKDNCNLIASDLMVLYPCIFEYIFVSLFLISFRDHINIYISFKFSKIIFMYQFSSSSLH